MSIFLLTFEYRRQSFVYRKGDFMPRGIYKRNTEPIKAGDKYNKLTAIKFIKKVKNSQQYWLFRCDCGNEKVISASKVKSSHTKSCGCLINEGLIKRSRTHGMAHTKEYNSWASMKARCLNKKNPNYKNYGGRGITVCNRWMKFENFYADMGKRPKGKSIDRINNDKGYYKENCRWATRKEQNNNTRGNHLLTYKNRTQTVTQWISEIGINHSTFYSRLRYGWLVERALKIN